MKIKTKLIISNLQIIIIPIVIMLCLIGIYVEGSGATYWETMENVFEDKTGAYSVENLLVTYDGDQNLEDVKKETSRAGYHFSMTIAGKEVSNSITDDDLKQAKNLLGDLYGSEKNYTVSGDGTVVIHMTRMEGTQKIEALAIRTKDVAGNTGGSSYMRRYVGLYVTFICLILIIAIVIVDLISAWWVSRSILPPLKKLSTGAGHIRDGDLDYKMTYNKKDEMGAVITDFDEMRIHLKESVEERLKYEKYRKDLMIGISHDLRTPLTSIKGYLEGLKDGIASNEDMRLKYYEAIETSTKNLENLVYELTDFSKLEAGEYHFDKHSTNLNEFYESCVEDMRTKYAKDSITIDLISCQEPVFVDIDRNEIERVNHNLIENTLKYREKTSSNVTIHIGTNKKEVIIMIKDDGPGVAEDNLTRIFESFYRGDAARTAPGEGSGIGLAVVKQIIEGHGGSVTAKNINGLAIIIKLPLSLE